MLLAYWWTLNSRRKHVVITLTVTSFNGAPMAQPLVAHFDETGGSIGRADNNQLALPDPERTISRVHARVAFRNGSYLVIDCGSNPVSVNGRPLGNGQEAPLKPGDELSIGGYAIKVEASSGGGREVIDPFADFGGLAAPTPPARSAPGLGSDPMAGFGMASGGSKAGYGSSSFGGTPAAVASSVSGAGGIPDDWNPFAPDAPSDSKRTADPFSSSRTNDFGMEVGGKGQGPLISDFSTGGGSSTGSSDSLDNLFGLGPTSNSSHSDPFANTPLQAINAMPNMAANADPLKSLNSLTRASATAASDAGSEMQSPFDLPPMVVPGHKPPVIPPPAVARPAAPSGAVMSWDDKAAEGRTIIRGRSPAPVRPVAAPTPAVRVPVAPQALLPDDLDVDFGLDLDIGAAPAAAVPVPQAVASRVPLAMPVPGLPAQTSRAAEPAHGPLAASVTPPTPASADSAALLAAFLEGIGIAGLPITQLTPELMRLVGQLLHEATRGTVDLLVARAALKREVRAEMTMIVARENNPLKFSPSVEVALDHLLKPPARGFMPPDKAMRDAYDDLRAHQFGFLAGMRAALEGVLKRFDPVLLEGKLTQGSMLSSMIPGSRKARMWDVFQQHYGQISAEASDDFHELFGKEFLRAYEAQLDQLQKGRG